MLEPHTPPTTATFSSPTKLAVLCVCCACTSGKHMMHCSTSMAVQQTPMTHHLFQLPAAPSTQTHTPPSHDNQHATYRAHLPHQLLLHIHHTNAPHHINKLNAYKHSVHCAMEGGGGVAQSACGQLCGTSERKRKQRHNWRGCCGSTSSSLSMHVSRVGVL